MSLNIIARKDYEDLQKNILNEKEQENKKSCLSPFSHVPFFPNADEVFEKLVA